MSDRMWACSVAGENLAEGVRNWQQAISMWAAERGAYNWDAATFASNTGHLCGLRTLSPSSCLSTSAALCTDSHQRPLLLTAFYFDPGSQSP